MKIKVEEWERNACRIRRKLSFSVAKHRGSETHGSEMSVIRVKIQKLHGITLCVAGPRYESCEVLLSEVVPMARVHLD